MVKFMNVYTFQNYMLGVSAMIVASCLSRVCSVLWRSVGRCILLRLFSATYWSNDTTLLSPTRKCFATTWHLAMS